MYTIAIYGRLYTAKGLSDVNIAKMQMANIFLSIQKFGW